MRVLATRLLRIAPALLLVLGARAEAQQDRDAAEWLEDCRRGRWGGDDARACDVREVTIPARGRLTVDGGQNGGISVLGWDRDEIRVVARMQASARRDRDASAILDELRIETGSAVRASGPRTRDGESWGVSFTVYVPRRTDLALDTHNGGIRIRDVDGSMRFRAVNGGVSLADIAGDVRGETQNGGLQVALAGSRWRGTGLDVRTQNGGVQLSLPERYDADLETGTVNGRFDIDIPITVRGRIDRTIRTQLGAGGPPVRVMTTNGGVSVRRR
jgi:hypothetical protein